MPTAAEWLSENSERQELALQNIPLAMELYARYKADIESQEFAEWLHYNQFVRFVGVVPCGEHEGTRENIWVSTKIHYGAKSNFYTTAQIHTIYKQSKTN